MKTSILSTTIALLTTAAFSAEKFTATDPAVPGASASGKATITIDVNGKKEKREIEFGNGTELKVTTNRREGGAPELTLISTAPKTATWLGVAPEEISEELRAQLPIEPGAGLVVRSVIADSPAAKAGLQKNDVLVKLDDQLLTNPSQLRTLVAAKKEGDIVKLTYFRRGQQATLDAKLATHKETAAGNEANWLLEVPHLGRLFQTERRAVVLDKEGKVIDSNKVENETLDKITQTLRDVGVDQKSIDEATRILQDTTRAIQNALNDATAAKEEVKKGSSEIAKALEQVRDAVEKVRKQAEEAVAKERERRR